MIKALIFISLTFFLAQASLGSDYLKGEGRFYAQDEDSIQFIKKQLLYVAFRDVLNKSLKKQGLDAKGFWEKFDQKFEETFEETKEELKSKYNIVEGEKVSPRAMEKYKDALRMKRFALRGQFASIKRAISSYAIKNMTRSTKHPKSRYLRLQAKVDRKILNKIYFRFIKSTDGKKFASLAISPQITLTNLTFDDLGVEVKNDLTSVIFGHWKKWCEENLEQYFRSVQVIEGDLIGVVPAPVKEEEEEEVTEDEMLESSFALEEKVLSTESLVLKINMKLSKIGERPLLQKRTIQIEGDLVLLNQKNNQILSHHEFRRQSHTFSAGPTNELGSEMASWIYRIPLMEFGKLKKNLGNNGPSKVAYLKVENVNSFQDIFSLNKLLEEKGVANQVTSEMKTYDGTEAKIIIYYHGSTDQLEQLIKGIKSLNIKNNANLDLTLLGV